MTHRTESERTAGGLVGKVAGKTKELVGKLTGNEDLAREGRLQHAQGDADEQARRYEAQARREQAAADVAGESASVHAKQERLETEVGRREQHDQIDAQRRQAERNAAEREQRAAAASAAEQHDAARLQDEAREAERRAAILDPKESA